MDRGSIQALKNLLNEKIPATSKRDQGITSPVHNSFEHDLIDTIIKAIIAADVKLGTPIPGNDNPTVADALGYILNEMDWSVDQSVTQGSANAVSGNAVYNQILSLRGGVPVAGDTLKKLYDDIQAIHTLLQSDDITLDQLQEIVNYIKNNRDLIEQVTTGKVSVENIVNNLTSDDTNKPLSAAQGKALKYLIDNIQVSGGGSVDLVNNIGPDGNKNITLTQDNIPDGDTAKQYTDSMKPTDWNGYILLDSVIGRNYNKATLSNNNPILLNSLGRKVGGNALALLVANGFTPDLSAFTKWDQSSGAYSWSDTSKTYEIAFFATKTGNYYNILAVTDTIDDTPPSLTLADVDQISQLTARFNVNWNESGTDYYAIFANSYTIAGTEDEKRTIVENGTGALQYGNFAITANTLIHRSLTGLSVNTGYKIYHFAKDSIGNASNVQAVVSFTTLQASQLTPPSVTVSSLSSTALQASWTDSPDDTGSQIRISTDNGLTWGSPIDLAQDTVVYSAGQLIGLATGTRRDVQVRFKANGIDKLDSDWTTAFGTTSNLTQLATPANFTATVNNDPTVMDLSWSDVGNETYYNVWVSPIGQNNWTQKGGNIAANATTYQVTGLTAATNYDFRLQAIGADPYSNSAYVTTSGWTNRPPSASSVTLSGTLQVGQQVTATVNGYSDPENNPAGTHLYQWYHNASASNSGGTAISGATSANYTIDVAYVNEYLYCVATPVASVGASPGSAVTSAVSSQVAASSVLNFDMLLGDITWNAATNLLDITGTTAPTRAAASNPVTDGKRVVFKMNSASSSCIIFLTETQQLVAYNNAAAKAGAYQNTVNVAKVVNGTATTVGSYYVIGNYLCLFRQGTNILIQTSTDKVTWTTRDTLAGYSATNYYVGVDILSPAATKEIIITLE